MPEQRPPEFKSKSFDCPTCGAFSQQVWASCTAIRESDRASYDARIWTSECLSCSSRGIWRLVYKRLRGSGHSVEDGQLIYPAKSWAGPAPHAEMPERVKDIYLEAAAVFAASPRSAAALLRLGLEGLLTDLFPEGNLNEKIGAAVKSGLPVGVQQTMDVIRFNGNQSVHELHLDDSAETAATLFQLLNYVVNELVARPRELKAMYEGLPEGVRKAVERRDNASE